jgi:hypothetical protein
VLESLRLVRIIRDRDSNNESFDGERNTVYYWFNPETGTMVYHNEVDEYDADPFFGSIGEAETYLKQQASQDNSESYEDLSLYKLKIRKVEEAVNFLTDQPGIDDFW